MQIADFIAAWTGRSLGELFMGSDPLCELSQNADGTVRIDRWDEALGPEPTPKELAEALAAPPPLDGLKAALKISIDAAAEAERQKYLTPGEGQAMTYQEKAREVEAYRAATNPQDSDYPFLMAGIGVNGETLADVVDTVEARRDLWVRLGSAIEQKRELAKLAVDQSTSEDEARTATIVDWPVPPDPEA